MTLSALAGPSMRLALRLGGAPALTCIAVALALAPPVVAQLPVDADGDGVPAGRDCNDRNPAIRPGVAEIPGNDVDENCDGRRVDRDGDSFRAAADNAGTGRPPDCDDGRRTVNPGAKEVPGNDLDENCDGRRLDRDGDGYRAASDNTGSGRPADCDDGSRTVNPGASEVPGNERDENCDGRTVDRDGDGYYASADNGTAARAADCDDGSRKVNPGAVEVPGNRVDENCDGRAEGDADKDGFGIGRDCDELNRAINPGVVEIPGNAIDENCDGRSVDRDADGFLAAADNTAAGRPADCDDADPATFPGAGDALADGRDRDCNGVDGPPTSPLAVTPSAAPTALFTVVRLRGRATRRGARITRLTVEAPIGTEIRARCGGRNCPFKASKVKVERRVVRFRRLQRHLRAGSAIELRVLSPGRIGRYTRFRIRRGRAPVRTDRCMLPGSGKPQRCAP